MNRENIIVEMLIRDGYLKLTQNNEIEKEKLILEAYDQRKTHNLPDLREDDTHYTMSLLGYNISRVREIITEINKDFKEQEGKKRRRKTKKRKSRRHQKRKSRRHRKRKSRRHKKFRKH